MDVINIYFGYGYRPEPGNEFLGSTDSVAEAMDIVNKTIQREIKNGFKSYYTRVTLNPECYWFDYGSHSKFIKITDMPENMRELWNEYEESRNE